MALCINGQTSGCEVANIYVIGDVNTMGEVMMGLATMFGSPEWVDTGNAFGAGSNLSLALLFSFLAIVLKGIISQKIELHHLMVSLLVFGVFFVPTMPVQVVDYGTGRNSGTITGVPVGIGIVGYASSSLSYQLTEEISQNFGALDGSGNGISPFRKGFLDPLVQVLMLRKMALYEIDEKLNASVLNYWKFCVENSIANGQFDPNQLKKEADPLAYLTDTTKIGNFISYQYGANGKEAVDCHAQAGVLASSLSDAAVPDALLGDAIKNRVLVNQSDGSSLDYSTIDGALRSLQIGGNNTKKFMITNMIYNTYQTARNFSGSDQDALVYSSIMTQALEKERIDSTASASIFLNYMQPLMSVLQFIFYASAPIMALVLVASGMAGFTKAAMYVLFGVWAHSWLPFAAIVNAYIQAGLAHQISDSTNTAGLSMAELPGLYNVLANKLSAAGVALTTIPVISLALLMGSPYSLTSLGNRFSSSNNVPTDHAAPNLMDNRAVATNRSMNEQAVAGTTGTGSVLLSEQQKQNSVNWGAQKTQLDGQTKAKELVRQSQADWQKSISDIGTNVKAAGNSKGIGDKVSQQWAQSEQQAMQRSVREALGNEVDSKTVAAIASIMSETYNESLGANASAGFSSPFGGASITAAVEQAKRQGIDVSDIESMSTSEKAALEKAFATSVTKNLTEEAQTAVDAHELDSHEVKDSITEAGQDSKTFRDSYTEQEKNARLISDQNTNTAGINKSVAELLDVQTDHNPELATRMDNHNQNAYYDPENKDLRQALDGGDEDKNMFANVNGNDLSGSGAWTIKATKEAFQVMNSSDQEVANSLGIGDLKNASNDDKDRIRSVKTGAMKLFNENIEMLNQKPTKQDSIDIDTGRDKFESIKEEVEGEHKSRISSAKSKESKAEQKIDQQTSEAKEHLRDNPIDVDSNPQGILQKEQREKAAALTATAAHSVYENMAEDLIFGKGTDRSEEIGFETVVGFSDTGGSSDMHLEPLDYLAPGTYSAVETVGGGSGPGENRGHTYTASDFQVTEEGAYSNYEQVGKTTINKNASGRSTSEGDPSTGFVTQLREAKKAGFNDAEIGAMTYGATQLRSTEDVEKFAQGVDDTWKAKYENGYDKFINNEGNTENLSPGDYFRQQAIDENGNFDKIGAAKAAGDLGLNLHDVKTMNLQGEADAGSKQDNSIIGRREREGMIDKKEK